MDRLISAPDAQLSAVLVALCDDDRVQARALKYLAELQSYATQLAGSPGDPVGNPAPGDASGSNPLKRKALASEPDQLEIQLCIQCKHAFAPADNTSKACMYHNGELRIVRDHDVWDDWDEGVMGDKNTPENEEDNPEGWSWCKYGPDEISTMQPGVNRSCSLLWQRRHEIGVHQRVPCSSQEE